MTDVVFHHDGTLDKYIGDGVLAFFGDPIRSTIMPNAPWRRRSRCASGFAVSGCGAQGDEEFNVGIGRQTRLCDGRQHRVGARTEYTVIGNGVRLAAHLAQIAGPESEYSVSDQTSAAPDVRERVHAVSLEAITLERSRQPVDIFEISDLPAPMRHRL